MKNWDPLVFGPALAMASLPGLSNLCENPCLVFKLISRTTEAVPAGSHP